MSIWRYALMGVALVVNAQQPGPNFYSVEKEVALGTQLAREMASKTTPLNDAAASAYVDRVVRELAAQIPDSKFRYVVTIVKDDVRPEPVVLPGGFIYVPTGMFAAAQNESEFAGLLARAMVEVAQRNATRLLTRGDLNQIAMQPLLFMDGWQGYAIRQGMGGAIPQGMQVFRRQLQMASEEMAVRVMAASGYDPLGLGQSVSRTGKDDGAPGWDQFQQRRLATLRQDAAAATVASGGNGAEFARVREMLAK
jgi:beta-barrel assembly-enhancing protease